MQKNPNEISEEINQSADRLMPYVKALSDVELARLVKLAEVEQIIRAAKLEAKRLYPNGVTKCPTK